MTMKISGWGRYPTAEANVIYPQNRNQFADLLKSHLLIARGLGRSYGDSANNDVVAQTTYFDHYISFNPNTGIISCEAGLSIEQLLRLIVPHGWFIPVSPGTSKVTIGGAIASDVHGKNHHVSGTFSQHLLALEIMLGSGEVKTISRSSLPDLFHATCGGMGLTGIILAATIQLMPIQSALIHQRTIRTRSLEEVCQEFELHTASTYSVAWIDCLSTGKHLGRSLLMLGEHAERSSIHFESKNPLSMPIDFPSTLLNRHSIKAFNTLYYHKNSWSKQNVTLPLKSYFYPLDAISDWNRMYGKNGFFQYQFVLPKEVGYQGLQSIMQVIAQSGMGSFLAVLKAFGPANENLLSFPRAGFTLALDFKVSTEAFKLAARLDAMVQDFAGRLYLTKDALMDASFFKRSYPKWEEFQAVRAKYGAIGKFASSQSRRLGLD